MKIFFDDTKSKDVVSKEVEQMKKIIPKLEPYLKENLSNYMQFLSEQENKGNYLEIYWPFFELGITLSISKIKEKFLISLLNYNDSIVFGNLLIDDYPCISNAELKKLGNWRTYCEKKLKIIKSF